MIKKIRRSKKFAIALLILIFISSAFAFFPKKSSLISKTLSKMSPDEHYFLATFMRGLLFSDDFSYLLFGSKPIAAGAFEKTTSFYFSKHCLSPTELKMSKGLEVFKKNQHLFSSKNIIVRLKEGNDASYVLMINKKNLLKILNENINDFKQVLGPKTTVEQLFTQVTQNDHLSDVIKNHEGLLGILLGYGRNNAWLFHEYRNLFNKLNRFEPPMKRDASFEERFNELDQKTDFSSYDPHEYKYILKSPRIPLPHFRVDPNSAETKKLKEQYGKEREEMKKLFAKQNFVEATFRQLMDE